MADSNSQDRGLTIVAGIVAACGGLLAGLALLGIVRFNGGVVACLGVLLGIGMVLTAWTLLRSRRYRRGSRRDAGAPPPGWYPAPDGAGLAFWDGQAWTAHRAPAGE